VIFEPPVSLQAPVRATTERGFGSRIRSSIDAMASVSLPSLNVRYLTKSMMPCGKVWRILRNAAWGTFAQDLLIKDEGTMNWEVLLERFGEPCPSDEAVQERPGLQDAQIVAYFLHVRARKPAGKTG
jgi:hypothetical protein